MAAVAAAAIVAFSPVASAATTTSPTQHDPGNTTRDLPAVGGLLGGLGLGDLP